MDIRRGVVVAAIVGALVSVTVGQSDSGRRVYFDFDGVMAFPKVYVNGQLAGQWDYGYMSFRVDDGPADIAGVGNGNPLSIEPFQADYRKLFYGKAMLILRTKEGQTGKVRVAAESDGLTGAETVVSVSKP